MNKGIQEVQGFAFLCNDKGVITKVLRNDFDLDDEQLNGKLFTRLVDKENFQNALDFMLETQRKKTSFDYRLQLRVRNKKISLYFIGIKLPSDLLIIGADNHKEAVDFANHLQQINNEQANLIRSLLKENASKVNEVQQESEELFNDISHLNNELVNLQRELTRKNKELERLNEIKNRFMGMAAHDLRNPLGIILNYSDFLKDDLEKDLSEEHNRFLDIIGNTAEFMLSLVEDLLDYSKITSDKVQLHMGQFDLVKRMRDLIDIQSSIASKKNIKVNFQTKINSLDFHGDVNKFDQVIVNLLSNAIKYSYPKTEVFVKIAKKNKTVTISIKDSGIGIPEEHKDKVFVPYAKITAKGTSGEKSTGLGLSIVKTIVESHGGDITFESEHDKGTTFTVTFPLTGK